MKVNGPEKLPNQWISGFQRREDEETGLVKGVLKSGLMSIILLFWLEILLEEREIWEMLKKLEESSDEDS